VTNGLSPIKLAEEPVYFARRLLLPTASYFSHFNLEVATGRASLLWSYLEQFASKR